MLGVNAEKARQLEQRLKRQGFEYRFPVEPPKADMVRHGFVKYGAGEGAGREREWKVLNERKNGYHNITDLTSGAAKDVKSKEDQARELFKAGKSISVIASKLIVPERIIERWVKPAAAPNTWFGKRAQDSVPVDCGGDVYTLAV
jgi:hypothetical protein